MKASVVIPTKNAGPLFRRVLDAVVAQNTDWPFEVIVIDSGSRDGTVEMARANARVRVLTIPPEEFGHGRTRNFAIGQASGEFVAMITHDALPASQGWLAALVAAASQQDDIAGAFGRHLAYPDADPFTARDLKRHFEGFDAAAPIQRMDDRDRYSRDQGYRQFLHFFSDNNACLRRSVWERIPYPDVDFAEDQIWAKTIIEAGYAKAYAPAAAVYHSHSYNVIETARRAYDEAAAFQRLFGYNLGPSASHAVRQTINCTLHDVGWSLRQPRWWRLTGWMARAPFANVARQGGYYLGGRHARIPGWLRAWMSRDGRLKNQRA